MFITIRQVEANGKNLFQVEEDAEILFRAQTPWANIRAPLHIENLRKLIFTDVDGNEAFHTTYSVLENTMEEISQYKYLFGTSAQLMKYQVIGRGGQALGAFYTQIDGIFASQMIIEYRQRIYNCYNRALGKTYVVSVFDGERQIAQISKPLDVWDRLDVFYLHLDEAYRHMLPILSFFTVYVDALKFNRPGWIAGSSVEKSWSYTFDRNNDKYDPDWVSRTFGREAAWHLEELLQQPQKRLAQAGSGLKNRRWIRGIMLAGGLIFILLAAVLGWRLLRPTDPLPPQDFVDEMQAHGYGVQPGAPSERDGGWQLAYAAEKGECRIWYLSFASVSQARQFFLQAKNRLLEESAGAYKQSSVDFPQGEKYTLNVNDSYTVVSRIENTVILSIVPDCYQDGVQDILRGLGY